MLLEKEIDEIDKQIIELLQKDPSITHSKIAKKLNRSQPAIGARIKKLSDSGILATQIGVDFKKIDLNLVKVEMICGKPEEIMQMSEYCPYVINSLKLSGEYNIMLFMACSSLKRLDIIIDRHFRNKKWISKVKMDLITQFAKKLVLPIDFNVENFYNTNDPCSDCPGCKFDLIDQEISEKPPITS